MGSYRIGAKGEQDQNPYPNIYIFGYSLRYSSHQQDQSDDCVNISKLELDSHANMFVFGCCIFILPDIKKTADISLFMQNYSLMVTQLLM